MSSVVRASIFHSPALPLPTFSPLLTSEAAKVVAVSHSEILIVCNYTSVW